MDKSLKLVAHFEAVFSCGQDTRDVDFSVPQGVSDF
jgi:hypothetical protein